MLTGLTERFWPASSGETPRFLRIQQRRRMAMATQIAPTPLVKGEAAKKIYKEMQRKPTQASKKGAKILFSKFSKMVKE